MLLAALLGMALSAGHIDFDLGSRDFADTFGQLLSAQSWRSETVSSGTIVDLPCV